VITEVRRLSQDTNTSSSLQRFTDAELLGYANQTLKRMSLVRPDLFAYVTAMTCAAGEVMQDAPTDSIRIMEVLRVSGGNAVRETNRETLDQTYPGWGDDAAAATVNWMRHPRHPNKFFIYPKAPASQDLVVEYAQSPTSYAADDDVLRLSDAYFTAVVDGTMWLAQSVDDEHVLSQRAAMFQQSFVQQLQANLESRIVTDLERGGHKPEDER
ncbi:MAG: hypothetical protein KDA17_07300, partial [Candidatus Saccharibacteria bacterium]|nr:hypothetical protein [Candidatus Saccharibacteria bacterium]